MKTVVPGTQSRKTPLTKDSATNAADAKRTAAWIFDGASLGLEFLPSLTNIETYKSQSSQSAGIPVQL